MAKRKTNVVALDGTVSGYDLRRRLADGVGQSATDMEVRGNMPTGAVWVVMDDLGNYRTSWDASQSALPARALVGIAMTALTKVGN